MRTRDLLQTLSDLGAKPSHRDRILRAWLKAKPLDSGPRNQPAENYLPLTVRQALPQLQQALQGLARVEAEHPGGDDSARLLVKLEDGQTVESVLLPKEGVCVSTQVGCAVGCTFCMTGQSGLLRQLDSSEILAQVVLARSRRPLRRVVFMGMGEPSHNLEQVMEAITMLGTLGGLGHKDLVFSSVGDPRIFERLAQGPVKPALALSLHSTRPELRQALLPRATPMDPAQLVEAAEHYARLTGNPIQYQWTLLAGINDTDEELEGIVRLLKGKYAMLNFIPYNSNEGLGYQRPEGEAVAELTRRLNRQGILTRIRNSAGQEVDGGCGQLRARSLAEDGSHPMRFKKPRQAE